MHKPITASLILNLLTMCFMIYPAFAGDTDKKNACDTISQAEIRNVLKNINATNAEILYVKDSPLVGICEVAIDRGGQPGIFYIDIAKTHLLFGNLLEIKTMTNHTAKSAKIIQDKKRIDISKISLTEAIVMGDLKARKKVIILTDPDCPYCSDLHKVMKQIVDKRKDIAFYIKLYPLEFHKDAYWKSKSIVCNKSIQLLQDCFDKKEIAKTDCKTEEVDNTIKLAKSLSISGTPAIILPDGRLRMGTMPEVELTNLIDGKI